MKHLLILLSALFFVGCDNSIPIQSAVSSWGLGVNQIRTDSLSFSDGRLLVNPAFVIKESHVYRYFLISYSCNLMGRGDIVGGCCGFRTVDMFPTFSYMKKYIKETFPHTDTTGLVITNIYEFKNSSDYNSFYK